MTLATKLTLALWAGILLVHSIAAGVRVERERSLFEREVARDAQVLGRALSHATHRAFEEGNEDEVLALLRHATARETSMRIRWVWLDDGSSFVPPQELIGGLPSLRAKDGSSLTIHAHLADEAALVTYLPMRLKDGRFGALEIADALAEEHAYIRDSVVVAVATSAVLAALCALLAWGLLSHLVRRPLHALVDHARRISVGDFTHRVLVRSRDEIGTFSAEMNRMCDRLQASREEAEQEARAREIATEQLRHADRLKTVGTLASGIAHELGTPINVVEGHAQLVRELAVAPAVRQHLDVITRQCKRMTAIIRQLLDFSRRGGAGGDGCDIMRVVEEALTMVEPMARKSQVTSHVLAPSVPIRARIGSGHLQQVVLNLLINSIQAMPDGGDLRIEVGIRVRRGPDTEKAVPHGCIEVHDSGSGMDADVLQRIFEPFFTTKEIGEGTGLGLSVAYGIVRDSGGWIEAQSQPGAGTRFLVLLRLEKQPDDQHGSDRR